MGNQCEIVGHNFWVRATDLAQRHGFAFSVTLRLATGGRWIAYFVWQEKGTPSQLKNVQNLGKLSFIASGAGSVSGYQTFPDVSFPKEILDYDPTQASLRYTRMQYAKGVRLTMKVQRTPPRLLHFYMLESRPAVGNETLVMDGLVSNFAPNRDSEQVLVHGGPWAHVPALPFALRPE